ncbi:Non-repetitive/WGA-negative nucleoporin C-terminal-domain-containing protein [Lentinula detonsa]|uniref:Non-repetitive/WGA-negative nucleoporin C-terminal-domain-containing protein n=1 Tax=Lentinula detonsa TaxID=2804962 RepID=A0A9W8P0Z1_9AGAR|nr:Non-repetitive/WGA-negative nucleoporin C-terminal-domain-containing protein [Lentinula detonsa]
MATFSPSPAPRRSSRLRSNVRPTSPPRRTRLATNNSRLSTPNRIVDSASVVSLMDIGDAGSSAGSERSLTTKSGVEYVFAKSDQLTVSFYANLPLEVTQILRNADFYRDVYSGEIDTLTGFALVASMKTCFVWQHAMAVKGIPTCYIFTCPYDVNQTNPPFHSLVPWGSGREPGLILLSTAGEIRFWDSVGIGLAGGDRYSTTYLELKAEGLVTGMKRVDTQTYIVSTTLGSLYKLVLTSTGGKYHLSSNPFSKPSTSLSLSRLIPFFSSSSSTTTQVISEPGNISAIALGSQMIDRGQEIWVLIESRIQKWVMKLEGWEEILQDEDVANIIQVALRTRFGDSVEKDDAKLDLELVDLVVDSANKIIVLVSYEALEQVNMMAMDATGIRRIYSLVQLSPLGDSFKVEAVISVPYQSTSSSGAPMHPRIQALTEGHLISIQFGDAVALCARASDYQERLELKSATDRTLGVGIMQNDSVMLLLTAATTMKVNIDVDNVLTFDTESGKTHLIKSIMTQAILYGSLPNNPLHFSFPPEVDEDSLMQAAQQLSAAILQSDPDLVRGNQDLSSQLKIRVERLAWLIQFVNENTVLNKMSQRCRQVLATDSEKLNAAYHLWTSHNELLATGPAHSVLNDAVYTYMNEYETDYHEDFMRAFFKFHVKDLGVVMEQIPNVALNAAQQTGRNIGDLLPEANRILLTVLTTASRHREQSIITYGIDLPTIDSWTSTSSIIDGIHALFDTTTRISEPPAAANQHSELHNQLPELAEVLFACISQRLERLAIDAKGEASGIERELHELQQKFDMLRPEVLETLRRGGHAQSAFKLAEKYQDFDSLAALCHRESIYPPEDNPNFARIQGYVERFKEQFTNALYRWYIQHGEVRTLFAQGEAHNAYIDQFFEQNSTPSLSWLHDLGNKHYLEAAGALLAEAQQTASLEVKHLELSIGKLANLAHLRKTESAADDSLYDAFHDALDVVGVHEALLDEFNTVVANMRGRRSLDTQADTIIKAKASLLPEKRDLTNIFRNSVKDLLQGKSLSIEDTVDVLTLKDNFDSVGDYATALHLLARCNLPEARKHAAFTTVWRRIYLHDDWKAIQKTSGVGDAELSQRFRQTALYSTFLDILSRPDEDVDGFEIDPDLALVVPTVEEISSRWPGLPQDQVERIHDDYEIECDKLGDFELEEAYSRVRELAEIDILQG